MTRLAVLALCFVTFPLAFACSHAGLSSNRPNAGDNGGTAPRQNDSGDQTAKPAPGGTQRGATAAKTPPPAAESSGSISQSTDEGEIADKPQPVSGAFLACAPLKADDQAGDGLAEFGCRVMKPGAMVDLAGVPVTWDVANRSSGTTLLSQASMVQLPAGSPWHVSLKVPADQVATAEVHATVTWPSLPGQPETLKAGLTATGGMTLVYGTQAMFHVGDGQFDASHCQRKIRVTPLFGKTLKIPFTVVDPSASVTVTLSDVCGVDYSTNQVAIMQGDKQVASTNLTRGARDVSLPALALDAGDYALLITSGTGAGGDHDDFVVGNIYLEGTGSLTGGDAVNAP